MSEQLWLLPGRVDRRGGVASSAGCSEHDERDRQGRSTIVRHGVMLKVATDVFRGFEFRRLGGREVRHARLHVAVHELRDDVMQTQLTPRVHRTQGSSCSRSGPK
jgi:hypothetical protein